MTIQLSLNRETVLANDVVINTGPSYWRIRFVGSKNYAYKNIIPATGERDTVCKVRGITLNYGASRLVNFDALRDLILGGNDSDRVTIHTEHKIKSKTAEVRIDIITEPEDEMYRIPFFGRRRLADNTSVPFCYINER
jgi:hypothetical protein